MRDKYIQTAESVTEGHPDKLCDTMQSQSEGKKKET